MLASANVKEYRPCSLNKVSGYLLKSMLLQYFSCQEEMVNTVLVSLSSVYVNTCNKHKTSFQGASMAGLQTATKWSHFATKIRHSASKFFINSRMRDK